MNNKNFMLVVQGEGRGHFTQAIALYEMLRRRGHGVSCVIVGKSSRRVTPEFFIDKIDSPVVEIQSPNFVTDGNNKSIRIGKTIWKNFWLISKYRKSIGIIKKLINFHQPDVIINFYEPLIGLFAITHRCNSKIVAIAHQYIYLNDQFRFPGGKPLSRFAIKNYSRLTTLGSDLKIALSFYDLPASSDKRTVISPPILRRELMGLEVRQEDFLLVYLVNSGYIQDILDWHKSNPAVKLHCFTDSRDVKEKYKGKWQVDETLCFHYLDDKKFLEMMSRCKGLVSTAGFESICEAMYLGKPVMMVPIAGHFEQYCNSRDAGRTGAGIYNDSFNLDEFIDYLPFHRYNNKIYRAWVNSMENVLMHAIESLHMDIQSETPKPIMAIMKR